MRELAQTPLVALELLTLLRLRRPPIVAERGLGEAQAWFPAVGLLLGGLLAGLAAALDGYVSTATLGWLLVGGLAVLTGGLHIDGLADTVDGLFGGRTPERRLAIMRDGAIGAFGAAAVVVALGLKATTIVALPGSLRLEALLVALCLSRGAMVVAIGVYPYARPEGLGRAFHGHALPWAAPFALATALAAAVVPLGGFGVALWAAALTTGLVAGGLVAQRLGGLTGDTYGAINELTEVLLLLLISAAATRDWIG